MVDKVMGILEQSESYYCQSIARIKPMRDGRPEHQKFAAKSSHMIENVINNKKMDARESVDFGYRDSRGHRMIL